MCKLVLWKGKEKIIIYKTEDGKNKLEVKLENETIWLTQDQWGNSFIRVRKLYQNTLAIYLKRVSYKEKQLSGSSGQLQLMKSHTVMMFIT